MYDAQGNCIDNVSDLEFREGGGISDAKWKLREEMQFVQ